MTETLLVVQVVATAYDVPIPGYGTKTCSNLRLWHAAAKEEFDLEAFNAGDYTKVSARALVCRGKCTARRARLRCWELLIHQTCPSTILSLSPSQAVEQKRRADDITAVLYPNDATPEGKELRLKQQFFFVSASLQDVIARLLARGASLESLPDKAVFQLNDTHPTIGVAELMRLLVDEHGMAWDKAWAITTDRVVGALEGVPERGRRQLRFRPCHRPGRERV